VKTATVTRGPLTFAQSFPANVSYNEYQYAIVQARAAGFIDKVYPLTVGDKVQKGAPLLDLTIPDWVEAQSEYLLLRETGGTATQTEGILERLRLAGMPEADIRRLIATQKIQTRFTLKAPIDGVITAFDLRAGMNIAKDNVVAKIQGMDPVWITAAIPESIAWLVKDASQFTLTVPARPDKTLTIRKWTLLPGVDAATRTLQLRLEVDNTDEALKPGMNAWLQLNTASEPMLLIPSQALIDTGSEQRVITVDADGRFVPKRVAVFQASQGVTALRSGLAEGEKVVSSGLFLIDSEANISGALERMRSESATHAH
ncbi:TPA: Cu(+)/Ag(+) efflux RND transporter periplasmic adaptor subunit CusB, partial [Escherichia coli]|nr:Cu(+)/Ag(+) efflux RND transporter periplasmic adaptor subunit CusB [Escherichia coli]